MESLVFVFVAAGGCGGCIGFKQRYWDKVKEELEKLKYVQIVQIDVSSIGAPLPSNVPQDLVRFIHSYPSLSLFTKTSWDKGGRLEGVSFNGIKKGDRYFLKEEGRRNIDPNTIISWVKEEKINLGKMINPLYKTHAKAEIGEELYTQTYCHEAFLPYN